MVAVQSCALYCLMDLTAHTRARTHIHTHTQAHTHTSVGSVMNDSMLLQLLNYFAAARRNRVSVVMKLSYFYLLFAIKSCSPPGAIISINNKHTHHRTPRPTEGGPSRRLEAVQPCRFLEVTDRWSVRPLGKAANQIIASSGIQASDWPRYPWGSLL